VNVIAAEPAEEYPGEEHGGETGARDLHGASP
jgi:hypothetical protein